MRIKQFSGEGTSVDGAAKMRARLLMLLCVCNLAVFPAALKADDGSPPPALQVPRIDRPMTLEELIDGRSFKAAVVRDFVQHDPREGNPASQETTAYLAYDQKNLYVGFLCADDDPSEIRAHVTPRDAIWGDDHVGVTIDTYYDHRRAYEFSVNPVGIQSDSLVSESQGEDSTYDTIWYSSGRRTRNGYAVVLAIPFKSLRFSPQENQTWGIILSRSIPRYDEYSTWPAISRQINGWLIQEAEVRGLKDISPGKNVQLIPYGFFPSNRYLDTDTAQFKRQRLK
jgi:hypothetical protein